MSITSERLKNAVARQAGLRRSLADLGNEKSRKLVGTIKKLAPQQQKTKRVFESRRYA